MDTTAVCQGLLQHPDNPEAALDTALALLEFGICYRHLPDLTILVTDDVSTAAERARQRDQRDLTPEQTTFMRRARVLHERLAATDPVRYRVIDRRCADERQAAEQIRTWIHNARTGLDCVREPWQGPAARCMYCGHRADQPPA